MDINFLKDVANQAFPQLKTRKERLTEELVDAVAGGNLQEAYNVVRQSVFLGRDAKGRVAIQSMAMAKIPVEGELRSLIELITMKTPKDVATDDVARLLLLGEILNVGFNPYEVEEMTGFAVQSENGIKIQPVRTNSLIHSLAARYPLSWEEGGYEPLEKIIEHEFVRQGTKATLKKLNERYLILNNTSVSEHDLDVNLSVFDCIPEEARDKFEDFCARMYEKHVIRKTSAEHVVPPEDGPSCLTTAPDRQPALQDGNRYALALA